MPRVVRADLAVGVGDHAVAVVAAEELQAASLDPLHLRAATAQRPPLRHRAPSPLRTAPPALLTLAAAAPPPSLARYWVRENSSSSSARPRSPEPAGGQPRAAAIPAPLTAATPWRRFRPPPLPPAPRCKPANQRGARATPLPARRRRHHCATRAGCVGGGRGYGTVRVEPVANAELLNKQGRGGPFGRSVPVPRALDDPAGSRTAAVPQPPASPPWPRSGTHTHRDRCRAPPRVPHCTRTPPVCTLAPRPLLPCAVELRLARAPLSRADRSRSVPNLPEPLRTVPSRAGRGRGVAERPSERSRSRGGRSRSSSRRPAAGGARRVGLGRAPQWRGARTRRRRGRARGAQRRQPRWRRGWRRGRQPSGSLRPQVVAGAGRGGPIRQDAAVAGGLQAVP